MRAFTGTQHVTAQLHSTVPLRLEDQIGGESPRLNDSTEWWVQVTGRLKPGITPSSGPGQPCRPFSSARRVQDSIASSRRLSRRTATGHATRDARRFLTWSSTRRAAAPTTTMKSKSALGDSRRGCRARAVARLRERRESPSVARRRRGSAKSPSGSPWVRRAGGSSDSC